MNDTNSKRNDIDKLKILYIKDLQDTINDLTLSLSMWIDGYPFDSNHKTKQKRMINHACFLIGKPRNMREFKRMLKYEQKKNMVES